MLDKHCKDCKHAKGRWSCWRRVLWCKLYRKPANVDGCLDFVRRIA